MAQQIIAIIGAGGKTTALGCLAAQNPGRRILVTTTTHIFPMEPPHCRVCLTDPRAEALAEALGESGIVCAGTAAPQGKLGILPESVLARAIQAADLVIYEGDGAHCLPLKLHRDDEPVILPGTHRCLIVAGLSALGWPAGETVHRYSLSASWQKNPRQPVAPGDAVHCVLEAAAASGLPREQLRVFLNQADLLPNPAPAEVIAQALISQGLDTRYGSLQAPPEDLFRWISK